MEGFHISVLINVNVLDIRVDFKFTKTVIHRIFIHVGSSILLYWAFHCIQFSKWRLHKCQNPPYLELAENLEIKPCMFNKSEQGEKT